MKKILTGIQPSGTLHIGNYLGTLKDWQSYTKDYECLFMIADLHSLTTTFDPKEKYQQVLTLAAEILAAGIDPEKCIFFRQSDVLEHTNLMWIFDCLTPLGYLERMTQFKDKIAHDKSNVNAGLFTYPVLQAADILLYEPDLIPVGQDQKQHVELTRDIVGFFNNQFGQTFRLPEAQFTKTPKIMSLTDSSKKMSKSHGEKTYIAMGDEPEVIVSKMRKAVTDEAGLQNLKGLAAYFMPDRDLAEFAGNNAAFKEELAEAIAEYFSEFRAQKASYLGRPQVIEDILAAGAQKARAIANKKLVQVHQKIGLTK